MTPDGPRLGPAQERILRLLREGLTPRQVAQALGVSTQRVYAARARLRELGLIAGEEAR